MSANRICMNSVLVPPAGVLDGELREPLLRFVQAAFALAARDLSGGAEVPFGPSWVNHWYSQPGVTHRLRSPLSLRAS